MRGLVDWRGRAPHLAIGGLLSFGVVLAAATLSNWPVWQSLPPNDALVRLSFTHSGARSCRDRTPEELAALPRNMRSAQICDRRRAPVHVEMDIDGKTVLARLVPPGGFAGSGPARIYQPVQLAAGSYRLAIRMRDDPSVDGFTHEAVFDIHLAPAQSLAVDFDTGEGKFFIHR
jgi:hypothetical protein